MRIVGLDEAGRGPVLGSLVMGAVVADESRMDLFREFGVRDSKALTRKARERLFDRISSSFEIAHELVTADDINQPGSNMNRLEYDALCRLMEKLHPDRLIVDAFLPPHKLAKDLQSRFPGLEVVAEWKADVNHPIVSAASIIAKVIRDREIDKLKETFGEDVGSGYPGDPKTKRWLRSQLLKNQLAIPGLPACVRLKWSTVDRLRWEDQ